MLLFLVEFWGKLLASAKLAYTTRRCNQVVISLRGKVTKIEVLLY